MRNLHYTVESVLADLTHIIIYNSNLPQTIIDFYEELQDLSQDLGVLKDRTGMQDEELSAEVYSIYQDIFDIYIDYLEKIAIEK